MLLLVEVARPLALFLLASQIAVFAFTAFVSFQWSVWAQLFARVVWPRLAAPAALVDARPARFAQLVGFVISAPAVIAFAVDLDVAGYGLTALAVGMAAVTAVTGVCLGCRLYTLTRRRQA
ncbi:DUF4395 domain-containing protein [Agrococcus sp. ProA11]|uniref:DUF4395 domain-containing protein n=1 Tax=Agrococcus chionoecetis TaxID=3153752 RepID=UPI00325FEB38